MATEFTLNGTIATMYDKFGKGTCLAHVCDLEGKIHTFQLPAAEIREAGGHYTSKVSFTCDQITESASAGYMIPVGFKLVECAPPAVRGRWS